MTSVYLCSSVHYRIRSRVTQYPIINPKFVYHHIYTLCPFIVLYEDRREEKHAAEKERSRRNQELMKEEKLWL
ncbi:hypothetical protein HMPREF1986_00825 [Oribacterium sp. oral taxon 078 str. F0263]|nr:hypothetical protein HMPREF1986_00825 [Oribacterium sp. oral taxon 078 str. F0263]